MELPLLLLKMILLNVALTKNTQKQFLIEVANLESISRLKPVITSSGEIYFLYPGGGVLFQYKTIVLKELTIVFLTEISFQGTSFLIKTKFIFLGGMGIGKATAF